MAWKVASALLLVGVILTGVRAERGGDTRLSTVPTKRDVVCWAIEQVGDGKTALEDVLLRGEEVEVAIGQAWKNKSEFERHTLWLRAAGRFRFHLGDAIRELGAATQGLKELDDSLK